MLHDAGLRVSALKVAQRQPSEASQGANTSSPYSAKGADPKSVSKVRGVVRSATFSAGSSGPSDAIALREHPLGQLSNRGKPFTRRVISMHSFHTRARQAQQAQLGTYWSNQLSPTSPVLSYPEPSVLSMEGSDRI